jgi:hypothetical protein
MRHKDGIIFINQISIPGSNIFEIFPFLFKSHKPRSVPGLSDTVTKLIEMGLQDYFVLSALDLKRKEFPDTSKIDNNDKWWFLN